jgi:hypothetical protein
MNTKDVYDLLHIVERYDKTEELCNNILDALKSDATKYGLTYHRNISEVTLKRYDNWMGCNFYQFNAIVNDDSNLLVTIFDDGANDAKTNEILLCTLKCISNFKSVIRKERIDRLV